MTTALFLGSGGREYVLSRAFVANPSAQLHAAPENPGLARIGTLHAVDPSDPVAVVALARRVGAGLVVVGPGASLVVEVADATWEAGIDCFGPSAAAAEPEGSKAFAKDAMRAAGVPTVSAHVCAISGEAVTALDAYGPPYVVENDGLATGKGVIVIPDRVAALAHAEVCGKVVIEEFLDGPELSLFAICDGVIVVSLLPVWDFKRVGDGDAGPNTGGMGAYCPLPRAPDGPVKEVITRVIAPTLTEMRRCGTPSTGLLYAGLALTTCGVRVVKFNVRFGDPEIQAVLALPETPLVGVLRATSRGELAGLPLLWWRDGAAVVIIEVARGYPGIPVGGGDVGLPADTDRARTVHAGTKTTDGRFIASGGRVLGVVGLGEDLDQARDRAREYLSRVDFLDSFHRTDTGIPH